MSVYLSWTGAVVGAAATMQVGELAGLPEYISIPLAAAVGYAGLLAWEYSPLPSSNGGLGMGSDFGMYWGFSKRGDGE